jgi:Arc/MetJ-type ribon-helix-helix transcriptional regulator
MQARTDLDHALQLRLPKNMVADIDEVIATVPPLNDFNRCRFIRAAVCYALDSIADQKTHRDCNQ